MGLCLNETLPFLPFLCPTFPTFPPQGNFHFLLVLLLLLLFRHLHSPLSPSCPLQKEKETFAKRWEFAVRTARSTTFNRAGPPLKAPSNPPNSNRPPFPFPPYTLRRVRKIRRTFRAIGNKAASSFIPGNPSLPPGFLVASPFPPPRRNCYKIPLLPPFRSFMPGVSQSPSYPTFFPGRTIRCVSQAAAKERGPFLCL